MTRIERQTAEAVVALLDAIGFLRGNVVVAGDLRARRMALRAALDADPAPAACDPYATTMTHKSYSVTKGTAVYAPLTRCAPNQTAPQQYDAETPE